MSKIRRFEDLIAWQKARALVRETYRLTRTGSLDRDYALRDQMRKAAISIPSNIAEGFERWRRAEFKQFLSIAKASCAELRTQLYIASDLSYINDEALTVALQQAEEVGRIIGRLRTSL